MRPRYLLALLILLVGQFRGLAVEATIHAHAEASLDSTNPDADKFEFNRSKNFPEHPSGTFEPNVFQQGESGIAMLDSMIEWGGNSSDGGLSFTVQGLGVMRKNENSNKRITVTLSYNISLNLDQISALSFAYQTGTESSTQGTLTLPGWDGTGPKIYNNSYSMNGVLLPRGMHGINLTVRVDSTSGSALKAVRNFKLAVSIIPTTSLASDLLPLEIMSPKNGGGSAIGGGIFEKGQNCLITATPDDGWLFEKWEYARHGDEASGGDLSFLFDLTRSNVFVFLERPLALRPIFRRRTFSFQATATPPEFGISYVHESPDEAPDRYGSERIVNVTVVPNSEYYEFAGWIGDDVTDRSKNPGSFRMRRDQAVTAVLSPVSENKVYVTFRASPPAGGTVPNEGMATRNSSIGISATPAEGYRFVRWACSSGARIDSETSAWIEKPAEIVAVFMRMEDLSNLDSGQSISREIENPLRPGQWVERDGDDDDDGVTNGEEVLEGTDLEDGTSKMSSRLEAAGVASLAITPKPIPIGGSLQLQKLTSEGWKTIESIDAGHGYMPTIVAPKQDTKALYRLDHKAPWRNPEAP